MDRFKNSRTNFGGFCFSQKFPDLKAKLDQSESDTTG